jgi:hypothetical protein
MNTRAISNLLIGLTSLMSVLAGCTSVNGAEPVADPTQAVAPQATAPAAAPVARPTDKPAPKVVPTSTAAPVPTRVASRGPTNLVVLVFTESGQKPTHAGSVSIYSNGLLVEAGKLKEGEGIYAVALPAGTYDVAVDYGSQPPLGYLKKDIIIAAGQSNTVTFNVPTEGKLKVLVYTKNGGDALKRYAINITSAGGEVFDDAYNDMESPRTLTFQAEHPYTVTVTYGTEVLQEPGVVLPAERTKEIKFTLPYDEGELQVYVQSPGQTQLEGNAAIAVSEAQTGKPVASSSYVKDDYAVVLKADTDYKVTFKYKDKTETRTIRVNAGGVTEETFVYPQE